MWDIKTRVRLFLLIFLINKHFFFLLKRNINLFKTGYKMRCIDFSTDGNMIVVGTSEGEVVLFKVSKACDKLDKIDSNRQRKSCIRDIK